MAKVMYKSLLCMVVLSVLLWGKSNAQTNPLFQHRNITGKELHSSTVNSIIKPTVISQPHFGEIVFDDDPVYPNVYKFEYRPGKIEANTKGVIEYWTIDSETGVLRPDYTTFTFRISKSLVTCLPDRKYIDANESIVGIDVLKNDGRSHGPLVLSKISYVENGMASISNNKINFTPDRDFTGEAFVYYTAKDTREKIGTGVLKIMVTDPNLVKEYAYEELISYGGQAIELPLPYSDFVLEGGLDFGRFEVSDGLFKYVPYNNQNSTETLLLRRGNLLREFKISVVEKSRPNSWVIDDIVYTSQGTPVTFDVEANDLKQNQTITDYSSDLVPIDNSGLFSYTPEAFFTGSRTFEYTVYNGYEAETGSVHLKVNNFYPQKQFDYNFRALSNAALVIEYLIPINNFSFELIEGPKHGNVSINTGTVQIDFGCTEIAGTNLVLYEPNSNFTGTDEFTLNYCLDGHCEEVDIKVEVLPNNLNECQCYTGCVWAGDANNDGLVNVVDLLSIAYSIGTTGAESDWNGGSGWIGRSTDDWLYDAPSKVNAKFSDSDGNGIVDELDFDAILDNYDRNHALVPPQLLDNKSYPFTLKPVQDTVYIGDLLEFEIGIGNEAYPALDVQGLAFSLGMPSRIVDSASVELEYYNDSWLAVDEAVYGIYKQVSDGWVETAVARMGTEGQSGVGEIGKLSFIVEEDLVGGFRISDGILPVRITLSEGKVMDANGQMSALPNAESTVYLNLKKRRSTSKNSSKLIAFPNPASDQITLHMNGGHEIISYELYDLLGQRLISKDGLSSRRETISTSALLDGTYILRTQTTFGPSTSKIEVVK